jgi:hypothetical protein
MAKRASKPKDPRTKEEVAAQKKTKGLKQPAIAKARKEVAKEKEEKKAKGAAIEAAAAPRRKKSSPSAPKTSARGDAGPLNLDRPEPAKPAKREKAEDVPQVRQAVKRSQDSKRLAQIGNADSLTAAERLGMQEMSSMPIQEIKKEAPLASDPLRPKPEPLPESVRSPFATGGSYTFDAPDRALSAPAGKAQSTDESSKVSKDLARRVKKGIDRGDTSLNLPGTPSVRERALEIAVKAHARAVERGEAHPLDVPTDTTPEVTTGHPMRQAIVEAGFNANESKLRSFASAKGMKFEDAVHGLYKTAQIQTAKDAPVNARVRKNKDSGLPELYDAKHETPPTTGFDVDLLNYLGADIHRKEGPKPAIEPRDRPRLKAQNILEELTGAKKSGTFRGKAKGGIIPYGPQEIDDSLNRSAKDDPYRGDPKTPGAGKSPTGDIARSGAGKYAPEPLKEVPPAPGKKPKAFGGATDSMGGAIPGPTKNPRISRSDRGRRQTPASSPTYRLSSAPAKEVQPTQTKSTQFEQLDLFPNLSKKDFQLRREMEEVVVKGPERKLDVREVPLKNDPSKTVKTTDLPEPVKLSDKAAREELSSRQRAMYGMTGAGAFSFGTTVTPAEKKLAPKSLRSGGEKIQTPAPAVSSGVAYTQPFLEPSLSHAKLAEKFPQDYAKTDSAGNPKKQNVWNMMSRQFLPGKEVEASPATKALQSQANMLRGKKDTMFEPPKSDATNIDKV